MDSPKAKILVVDDEANVLFTVEAILRQEGYEVEAVDRGAKAIAAISRRNFDVVLTDLKMPEVDGLAVLAEVRKRSPNTVTLVMTGYGSVDSALEAIQLGAYEYLLKPTEVPELLQAVRRSLERKRLSEIDTLYRVSQAITGSASLETTFTEVAEAARGVLSIANARVATLDAGISSPCDALLRPALDDGNLRQQLLAGEIVTTSDGYQALAHWQQEANIASFALVPGIAKDRLVCVLCVDNGQAPYDFHASARRFLQALASQTAMTLENSLLIAELKKNNEELAAANRKLQELDRLKSKFLSVATHELRTPLTVILGYNAMLEETLATRLSAEERDTLHESVAACKRLIRLVNSMLDVSMIESGRMKIQFASADLRQIVNSVVALFQSEARRRGLQLKVEMPLRLPRLALDSERMQQVLINLIGNAMKFTDDGGAISVGVRQRGAESLEMWVSDTGIGIPAEEHSRIFDEFTRLDRKSQAGHKGGAGLGLAIARRIVEAHGGNITVASSPGQGSTFTVTLPLNAHAKAVESAMTA